MASNWFVGFAIAAIVLPTVAMASEYKVGDDKGWNVNVNYIDWAKDKVFYVGDILVFQYKPPHNVYKVDGNGFKECKPSGEAFSSGNDSVTLSKPGKKWYICGVSGHCEEGQKLVINVEELAPTPGTAPPPASVPVPAPVTVPVPVPAPASNDSYRFMLSWYQIFIAAFVGLAMAAL